MRALHSDSPNRCGTPVNWNKVVSIRVWFLAMKLIGYHSKIPWATVKWTKDLSSQPTRLYNSENLEISPVHSEILGGICWIFPFFSHRYTKDPRDLRFCASEVHQIFTGCSPIRCAATAAIGVPIFQCVSERQHAKWRFFSTNFGLKLVAMARPLSLPEK